MLELSFLALSGGIVYAATKRYQRFRRGKQLSWLNRPPLPPQPVIARCDPLLSAPDRHLRRANRKTALASLSVGMAVAGAWLLPLFSLLSLSLVLYLSLPIFQAAYQATRQERRLTPSSVNALRIGVCVVAGFFLVAALDAFFYQMIQRLMAKTDRDYRHTLRQLFGDADPELWLHVKESVSPEQQPSVAPLDHLRRDSVQAGSVQANDVLIVSSGETIPAAGRVVEGGGWVREFAATGRHDPVQKGIGDAVLAPSILLTGQLSLQIEETASIAKGAEIHAAVARTTQQSTLLQEIGETSGQISALHSVLAWGISMPFLGANQAASFLCVGAGGHMRTLGPLALQNFLMLAAAQRILIKEGRALEKAVLINTIVLDAAVLDPDILEDAERRAHVHAALQHLRQRRWILPPLKIYLMTDGSERSARALAGALACDDYLVRTTPQAKADAVEGLQAAGRVICFVGDGVQDAASMQKAFLGISLCKPLTIAQDAGQILLASGDLADLKHFYALTDKFFAKERTNLLLPILLDIIDISTTLFLHLGVAYSLLFNYGGWLIGAANTQLPLLRYQKAEKAKQDSRSLHA